MAIKKEAVVQPVESLAQVQPLFWALQFIVLLGG